MDVVEEKKEEEEKKEGEDKPKEKSEETKTDKVFVPFEKVASGSTIHNRLSSFRSCKAILERRLCRSNILYTILSTY